MKKNKKIVCGIAMLMLILASLVGAILPAVGILHDEGNYKLKQITDEEKPESNFINDFDQKQLKTDTIKSTSLIKNSQPSIFHRIDNKNTLLNPFNFKEDENRKYFENGYRADNPALHRSLLDKSNENSTVCGYVTDVDTGLPIENVYVDLNWRDDQGHYDWNSTTTNSSGFYSMSVAAGEIYLYSYADGYFSEQTEWYDIGDYETLWVNISLFPHPPQNSVVCGYVTDHETSLPIENAWVDLNWRDNQGHYDWNSTSTNSLGFYSMNIAAGEFDLSFNSDGYYYEWSGDYEIGDYETLWVNQSMCPLLPENSVVCGYVTDYLTGLPIENAWVNLNWHDDLGHYDWNSTATNSSGYYSMGVAAGQFDLSFSADGYYYEWTEEYVIGEYETLWVNYSLYPRPVQNSVVCGYVSDSISGLPIENIWVNVDWNDGMGHWDWNSTATNSSGFYSINVAAGFFDLAFSSEDYYYERSEGHVIDEYETYWVNKSLIPLPDENSVVYGYVSDLLTGLPIINAYVDMYWTDNEGISYMNSTNTNLTGFYRINVAAGSLYLKAQADGYAWEVSDMIDVEEYQTLWENFSLVADITSPIFSNLAIPDYVGLNHPGDISVDIYDDTLQQTGIIIYDVTNITFDQNIVIVYYLDDSGESGTYEINDYTGYYVAVEQDVKSSSTTMLMFSNWTEADKVYTLANCKKNESSSWEMIILEFNFSDGLLNNIAIPVIAPDESINLEYISDMIEPGVSIFRALSLPPMGQWIEDPTWNFTLYSIGDPDNPILSQLLLIDGEYAGMIMAEDRADNLNLTDFNLTVYHDTEDPVIVDNTPSEAEAGEPFTFNATVTDNVGVAGVYVEYWYDSGSHTNVSMDNVAGDYWEETITIDSESEILHYMIAAVDTAENWASTDITDVPIAEPTPEPDLDCDGSLSWSDVEPGSTVEGSFTVENTGDPESELDWEVTEWPSWGTWTFDPYTGTGLTPEDGEFTIEVEVIAPNEEEETYSGHILIVNSENADDYCIIDVSLATPVSQQSLILQFLERLVDRFPNAFPILRHLMGL